MGTALDGIRTGVEAEGGAVEGVATVEAARGVLLLMVAACFSVIRGGDGRGGGESR